MNRCHEGHENNIYKVWGSSCFLLLSSSHRTNPTSIFFFNWWLIMMLWLINWCFLITNIPFVLTIIRFRIGHLDAQITHYQQLYITIENFNIIISSILKNKKYLLNFNTHSIIISKYIIYYNKKRVSKTQY